MSIDRHFVPAEVNELIAGIPDLSSIGFTMLVPFKVRRVVNASVVWVNDRWFLERGLDITEASVRYRVEAWLLDEFAFVVPEGSERHLGETRTWYCDRYGSTEGMSPHGGSGRVGTVGKFQAKGVGITPLVGATSQAGHAHGKASVAEGLREAVYAEIAAAEFPFGAVPTIAVLDCGAEFSSPDQSERYDQKARRGISVRPSVFRIAHIERAPLFRESVAGYLNSQKDDAQRVRDAVQYWIRCSSGNSHPGEFPSPIELMRRLGAQIAFGQVHRLFNGGFYSSNVSMDGRIFDFGNMHVLPDWSHARVLPHAPGFGSEIVAGQHLIRSLCFFLRKFGVAVSSEEDLTMELFGSHKKAMREYWTEIWCGLADEDSPFEELASSMQLIFETQQKNQVMYKFGRVIAGSVVRPSLVQARRALQTAAIANNEDEDEQTAEANSTSFGSYEPLVKSVVKLDASQVQRGLRYLTYRSDIARDVLLEEMDSLMKSIADVAQIRGRVAKLVSLGRLHWRGLPVDLVVHGHVVEHGSSALLCRSTKSGRKVMWVQGPMSKGRRHLFGCWLEDISAADDKQSRDVSWSAVLEPSQFREVAGDRCELRFGAQIVLVPPITVRCEFQV